MRKKSADKKMYFDRLAVQAFLGGQDKSIVKLAADVGISVQYMHDMLYGRRNPTRYITKVAKVLGVPAVTITQANEKGAD